MLYLACYAVKYEKTKNKRFDFDRASGKISAVTNYTKGENLWYL